MVDHFITVTIIILISSIHGQEGPEEVCVGYEDGTLVMVPGNCKTYYYCEGEFGYEEDCPEGEVFDQYDYVCMNEAEASCESIVDPETDAPETEPPVTLPPATPPPSTPPPATLPPTTPPSGQIDEVECPNDRPGQIIFFPSANCTQYYICANGIRMAMRCLDGFTWNQQEQQCDYPIFSRCSVSSISRITGRKMLNFIFPG